jgi:FkbM family methyltransferase
MSTSGSVAFEGKSIKFAIDNPLDHIQSFHRRGHFYEIRQLLAHRDLISMDSTVIDVGANVGNHTLFYAWHTYAKLIYPLEPNPRCRRLLEANIASNPGSRAQVRTDHLGIAAGSTSGSAISVEVSPNNLGAAKITTTQDASEGPIPVKRLDELAFSGSISLVKIDVEGMEIEVLAGAELLFKAHRPAIAVEVLDTHDKRFWEWADKLNYKVIWSFVDYLRFKNYIAIPSY